MAQARTTLPADPSSVPAARRWAEEVLTQWGHADLGWTAASVISELATNCHLHARTDFTIAISRTGDGEFLVEITDGSPALPQQRRYGPTSTTGRGLMLVDRLSDSWGVSRADNGNGKTIWVRLSERAEAEDDDDLDALLAAFDDGADVATLPRQDVGSPRVLARFAA